MAAPPRSAETGPQAGPQRAAGIMPGPAVASGEGSAT
jgi:hypothetical protein